MLLSQLGVSFDNFISSLIEQRPPQKIIFNKIVDVDLLIEEIGNKNKIIQELNRYKIDNRILSLENSIFDKKICEINTKNEILICDLHCKQNDHQENKIILEDLRKEIMEFEDA